MSTVYLLIFVFQLHSGEFRAAMVNEPFATKAECEENLADKMKSATAQVKQVKGQCVPMQKD